MNKLILFIAGAVVCSSTWAAASNESAVDDAVNRLSAAMLAGDAQNLKALTASTLSYGHSNGEVQDQAVFVDTIASGKTRYRKINLSNAVTKITGNVAVVREHFSGTVEQAGKLSDVDLDVLQVWQKEGGAWKLIARQGYKH
jgi:hypothetical protein